MTGQHILAIAIWIVTGAVAIAALVLEAWDDVRDAIRAWRRKRRITITVKTVRRQP